jgi:hypothetical protein
MPFEPAAYPARPPWRAAPAAFAIGRLSPLLPLPCGTANPGRGRLRRRLRSGLLTRPLDVAAPSDRTVQSMQPAGTRDLS